MKNKEKIGIVTWYKGGNYGTTLQAYALYRFLENHGCQCFILENFNYHYFSIKSLLRSIIRPFGYFYFKDRLHFSKLPNSRKYIKLQKFIGKNLKIKYIENRWQYKKMLRTCDLFCVGSDQLWNAYYKYNPFNFLDFAANNKKIAYAASMGTRDFPSKYEEEIKKQLIDFKSISLRESTGANAVRKLTNREDIVTVVDPTFLLKADVWLEVTKQSSIEFDVPEKFILCYFIGNNQNYSSQIEKVRTKTGIQKIVDVSIVKNPKYVIKDSIRYNDAGIAEFLMLLARASWICTDSFHATALSINLHKDFTEFLRFQDDKLESQNSRIYDILNTFKLSDRLYTDDNKESWSKPIDYTEPKSLLNNLRVQSSDWLLNAINV